LKLGSEIKYFFENGGDLNLVFLVHSHCQRACDTLRIIIKEFLPVIQANCDPWSPARSLGVDITREERSQKCLECRSWLLKIRCLPENEKIGNSLQPLQNMIVDI
jgi:katanin p80 WD40 repeat-containing subunit B1